MMPTNHQILDDKALDNVENKDRKAHLDGLMSKWGKLHAFRAVLGIVASVIPLFLVLRNKK
jgi:hypothetical protein